ncbi:hypothetical protein B0H19DRAFT_1241533 [Mycena capillaripes]|nr:hypothetical protein B0H19DRAFT_1241533 [Mycena capillaripes]
MPQASSSLKQIFNTNPCRQVNIDYRELQAVTSGRRFAYTVPFVPSLCGAFIRTPPRPAGRLVCRRRLPSGAARVLSNANMVTAGQSDEISTLLEVNLLHTPRLPRRQGDINDRQSSISRAPLFPTLRLLLPAAPLSDTKKCKRLQLKARDSMAQHGSSGLHSSAMFGASKEVSDDRDEISRD